MMASSSSLDRPVLTSASTPLDLKMSMAAGESLSAMRTRGVMRFLFQMGWCGEPPPPRFARSPSPVGGGVAPRNAPPLGELAAKRTEGDFDLSRLQKFVGDG